MNQSVVGNFNTQLVIDSWIDFDFIVSQLDHHVIDTGNISVPDLISKDNILEICISLNSLQPSNDLRFNKWFDLRIFESLRPDVAKHSCNSSLFFITELIKHGTDSGYFSNLTAQIRHAKQAFVTSPYSASKGNQLVYPDCRFSRLKDIEGWFSVAKDNVVLSFSHDNAYEIDGGVQSIIRKESLLFEHSDYSYIHIFPQRTRSTIANLSGDSSSISIGISINGEFKGYALFKSFLLAAAKYFNDAHLLIHHLYGFNVEDLIVLAKIISSGSGRILFWCHDHTILCSKYNLMFNNFKSCKAPSIDSFMCRTCSDHYRRVEHLSYIRQLLSICSLEIIYPSTSVRDTCIRADAALKSHKSVVLPHLQIIKYISSRNKINLTDRKVRIAYLGHAVTHKGWNEFCELRANPLLSQYFEFHYFGSSHVDDRFTKTFVSQSSPTGKGMTYSLKQKQIDIVFCWSLCPETFCLTAYEALSANSHLITNYDSGNIVNLPGDLCSKFLKIEDFIQFLHHAISNSSFEYTYAADIQFQESSFSYQLLDI